jgi:hypothetical protein
MAKAYLELYARLVGGGSPLPEKQPPLPVLQKAA